MTWRHGSVLRYLAYSAAVFAALNVFAAPVGADPVEVRTPDGLSLTGEMLGFDGRNLRLGTEHGVVTLDYAAVSCTGSACPDAAAFMPILRLHGEARLGTLTVPALIEAWALSRGAAFTRAITDGDVMYQVIGADGAASAAFRLTLGTTESGFAALLAEDADVLMATRGLGAGKLTIAANAGLGALDGAGQMRMLALDALVPVVAPGQQVHEITPDQLSQLFAGSIANWQGLGGEDLPVTLHLGGSDTGQVQALMLRFLREIGRDPATSIVHHADSNALLAAVRRDPGALGLVPFADSGFATPLALRGTCGALASPDPLAVRTEDYPLTFPQYFYRPERRLAPVHAEFLTWLSGAEAQRVLRRAGVLSQDPGVVPPGSNGARLATAIRAAGPETGLGDLQDMLAALDGLVRLTLTFRFEDGDDALDGASRTHARFLAHDIADGRFGAQRLVFVGFSDGAGSALDNLVLARNRAETARRAVLAALGGEWPAGMAPEVMAFGEALPIGCDDTIWGRQTNRRVELWTTR